MIRWSELTPRERDALVAEHVFGWSHIAPVTFTGYPPGYKGSPPRKGPLIPFYSTDIAAAWEVVEHFHALAGDRWLFALRHNSYGWECAIEYGVSPGRINYLTICGAATAPEAICFAALRAKGLEVET